MRDATARHAREYSTLDISYSQRINIHVFQDKTFKLNPTVHLDSYKLLQTKLNQITINAKAE